MWPFPTRNVPRVNYKEPSESESSDSDSPVSPPPGTPADESEDGLGQFRELTDQLGASEVISAAAEQLSAEVNLLTPVRMPPKTPYDMEDKEDGEDYFKRISNIKLPWDPDVEYWFNSIEASMRHATVHSQ